jgi:hypothetical protein
MTGPVRTAPSALRPAASPPRRPGRGRSPVTTTAPGGPGAGFLTPVDSVTPGLVTSNAARASALLDHNGHPPTHPVPWRAFLRPAVGDLDRAARRQIPHPYCGQPLSFVMVASMPPACTPGTRFARRRRPWRPRWWITTRAPAFVLSGRWFCHTFRSAGTNRHGGGDGRALRRRGSDLHGGPEPSVRSSDCPCPSTRPASGWRMVVPSSGVLVLAVNPVS